MTREEANLLSAYTGFMLTPDFGELQKFCEETLGRPVWTHEFADKQIFEDLRAKLQPKLEELIQNIDKPQMITREQVEKAFPGCHLCKCGGLDYAGFDSDGLYFAKPPAHEKFRFCPACGKPLTDEAVDMMLRRWEEAIK